MKRLQRPWSWPWATFSVVALFGSAAMLGIELGLIVLIFAGLIALVALRQIRERPNSESQDNPTLGHCQEAHTLQGSRLFPSLAAGMSIAPGQLAIAADLQPQPNLEAATLASRVLEMRCERVLADIQKERMAVTLPANAHAGYRGKGGVCDGAFRKQQDSCLAP